MTQSKRMSALESVVNQVSGFVMSLLLWQYLIAPLYDIVPDWQQNFEITVIFTLFSIVRSYCVRRIFNKY